MRRTAQFLALCGFLLAAISLLSAGWALLFQPISYANTMFALQCLSLTGLGGIVLALGIT